MKKYKVLIVHNYYKIPGGEDAVVENEKNMLKENGHEVIMYTKHNNEVDSSKKINLFFKTIFSLRTFREVKKIIKREKIDLVHVHNTLPIISPAIYYSAFSTKTPVVQTIHNFRLICPAATLTLNGKICEKCINRGLHNSLINKCYRNSLMQTFTVYVMLKLHRFIGTYKKINGYIALTEFNKNKLMNLIKDEEKIHIKPNFIKSNIAYEKRIPDNYFVFIGRLDKLKGTNILVETFKNITNTKLYIIGDGPERAELKEKIIKNKITSIEILGYMERDKAFKILKKAKALIIPSQWYEGFPMTVVEAFSFGVPVIASNLGNLSSIIINNENGLLFKHDDYNDLIKRIQIILENEELNDYLSNNAFETYENLYNDEINYKQLIDIYRKIKGDMNGSM